MISGVVTLDDDILLRKLGLSSNKSTLLDSCRRALPSPGYAGSQLLSPGVQATILLIVDRGLEDTLQSYNGGCSFGVNKT